MTNEVGVECVFREDGAVRVRRVRLAGKWLPVQQGRQWSDENGRHTLIMFSDGRVRELLLQQQTLLWQLAPAHGSDKTPV